MKIIGRTEAGARLVEISTAEISRLNETSETLAMIARSLRYSGTATTMPSQAEIVGAELARAHPKDREKTQATPRRARGASQSAVAAPAKSSRHKTCKICGKSFVDKSRTNSRKICSKASCKHEQKKKYQRNWMRDKHGVKNTYKFRPEKEIVVPLGYPADPGLSVKQSNALKAKRLALIKTLAEKHKYDDAT